MRTISFILILFISEHISAQSDTISVNGFRFYTKQSVSKNDFGSKDTLQKFYRIENGKPKYLLEYYSYNFSADCNNSVTERGEMKVAHDSILFLTDYEQETGMDPIPLKEKQIYKVNAAGKLILIYHKELMRYGGWVDLSKNN